VPTACRQTVTTNSEWGNMKNLYKTRPLLFALGLFVAVAVSGFLQLNARAVEGESIVLSPASKQIKIDAGKTFKDKLIIINNGTVAYTVKLYSTPYSVKGTSYTPDFDTAAANADVYQWVTYEEDEYVLNPGEKVEAPYAIEVPADATPGGHYGVLFAETQSDESSGQISRNKRVGTIVYATVNGDYITEGKQVSATIDWLQLGGPITAYMTVENTGNTDYTMTDYMEVKNVLGGTVYEKTNERIILPKTTRDIQLTWDNGPIMGLYNVKVESKILDKVETTSSWVLLMPMWMLVLSVLGIVGLIYWAYRKYRR
jgi:hypothetical protein